MSALAHQAAVDVPQRRTRERPERRRHVASGVIWIVLVAVLLAGVVAMNVTVLRLNVDLDKTGRERARLRAETASLSSQLSSAQASARTQSLARRAGLVPARAAETAYVDLVK